MPTSACSYKPHQQTVRHIHFLLTNDMMSERYRSAIAAFDRANSEDPNKEPVDGRDEPKELVYARRMSEMLERYAPNASEAVKLAVRAQHIRRWKIPRNDFPMDKQGYLQWRKQLYKFHARTAADMMKGCGYDDETIARVAAIVSKKELKADAETQMLEDVAGLVFVEHYLAGFAALHPEYDEEKWIRIIHRTWLKMSAHAHQFVLAGKIKFPETLVPLILKAVRE